MLNNDSRNLFNCAQCHIVVVNERVHVITVTSENADGESVISPQRTHNPWALWIAQHIHRKSQSA